MAVSSSGLAVDDAGRIFVENAKGRLAETGRGEASLPDAHLDEQDVVAMMGGSRRCPSTCTNNVLTMAPLDRFARQVRSGVELVGATGPQFLRPLVLELASHRPIREVLPGVHHWTAIHPKIGLPVDSYYLEPAGVILDPMVPREGLEWFEGREPPSQVVLTNRHHLRHSERYAETFDCPIRCSDAGLHEFEQGPTVEGFAFGDELAPGITAHKLGAICPDDTALHVRTAGGDALAFADGVTRPRGGGLAFVPGFLMGDDPAAVRTELRASLHRLLDLDFDNLLFAHGEPLIGGGKTALREFVGDG